ncbi:hypothetical protein BSL78_16685 [Apostichopus japonicus]|uniref:Uncharacterized protein n=1 Tax=Stichopus japonicus TaxID=307972 RepID=A0A2G8KEK0_STIJA|nr:hypothetical protein BSL78_16685 [Apostichopus japonicus]
MTVHLFGATSSPSCAGFALRKTAEDHKNAFDKDTSTAVLESFYVDDCLKSVPDAEQARRLSVKSGFQVYASRYRRFPERLGYPWRNRSFVDRIDFNPFEYSDDHKSDHEECSSIPLLAGKSNVWPDTDPSAYDTSKVKFVTQSSWFSRKHLRPIREEDIVPDSGGSGTEYCSETNRFVYPHLGSRGHSTSYIPVQNADITSNLTSDTESDGSSYIPSDDEKDNSSSISDDEPIQTRDLRQYIIADTSTNGQSDADSNCSHTTDEQSSSANDEPTPTTDHAGKKKRLKGKKVRSHSSILIKKRRMEKETSEVSSTSMTVLTSRNRKHKRVWDRHNFCIYCKKSFAKLPRHFERKR